MSNNAFVLEARLREDAGKGASRRLRRLKGEIPAIVYGGEKEPLAITLAHKDIVHATESEGFFSAVIALKVAGQTESVVIKDLQRHPAKPYILHADFQRVSADQAIHVKVPLHFLNEEKAPGVKLGGGIITALITELEISCLPQDLPQYIEVDVIDLNVGDILHIADLKLPEGVTSVDIASHGEAGNLAVVSVTKVRGGATAEDEEEDGEAEDGGEE